MEIRPYMDRNWQLMEEVNRVVVCVLLTLNATHSEPCELRNTSVWQLSTHAYTVYNSLLKTVNTLMNTQTYNAYEVFETHCSYRPIIYIFILIRGLSYQLIGLSFSLAWYVCCWCMRSTKYIVEIPIYIRNDWKIGLVFWANR